MTPPPTDKDKQLTRQEIDVQLALAGWVIQDKKSINLFAGDVGVCGNE